MSRPPAVRAEVRERVLRLYRQSERRPVIALGLASLRRSHVRLRHTSERDLGSPLIPFNVLIGHRSEPQRLCRPACHADTGRGAGFMRLSGGWTIASSGD